MSKKDTGRMSPLIKFKISPTLCLFFSIVLLIDSIYLTTAWATYVALYLSVLLHELGHALVGNFFGYEIKHLKLTCYGGCVEFTNTDWLNNNRHRFHTAAAGPLASLLTSCFCFYIDQPLWAELNLLFALFNLIPILPMDGAHMVGAAIGKYTSNKFIPLFIGVFSGFAASIFFSYNNFLATLFLMFFVGLNITQIYDLAMAAPPREYKKPKAKILFFRKEKLFVPIGMDRDLVDVVDEANIRLKNMGDIHPTQFIENILNEENMDYDLDLRIV